MEHEPPSVSLAGRQDLAVTDGLRVNLARTAVEVDIPDEHLVLLDVTAGWLGLEAATHDLLREVHHRYVAWPEALVNLHRRAMGDLHRYNAHDRGAEGIAVFCDLYAKVVEEASDASVRHDAMRLWLYYLEKLAAGSGDRLERNMAPLRRSLRRIGEILDHQPPVALGASPRLKRLAAALLAQGNGAVAVAGREALDVLARSLAIVYREWLAREDPAAWYREISGPPSGRAAPDGIAGLSHQHLVALAEQLERIGAGLSPADRASALLELPDNGQIVRAYLDAAGLFARGGDPSEALLAEMHWLFRVLGHPELVAVHEPALRQVRRCCSSLLAAADGQRPELLVREVFSLLRRGRFPYGRTVYDLLEQIGRDVLGRGDGALAEALFEETLGLDFTYPEFSGFSEEWEVLSNPDHLRNVRMYLGVIEADPLLARPLLAALVVHLKLGGLLVTDTDLFQRDISSLLGRPVGPVYLHVKQLLKLVPAYFNEIGAEGALREASTRLDELEGRRDPLCHFLRKLSHVECNPRLVTFVEEIIRFYWTGDPDPLRRYVPPELGERLRADDVAHRPLRGVLSRLAHDGEAPDRLFELEVAEVTARLRALEEADPIAVQKAELLFRVRHEIRRKYDLDHSDVVERLRAFGRIDWARVAELEDALGRRDHDAALERLLGILEALQTLILRAGPTEAFESIYHKRHIAAGIPSMYGSYREERFEAIGLSFRLESLATALLERVIDDGALAPLDRQRLARIAGWLRLLLRALRIDGYRAQGLAHCLSMLDEAVTREGTGLDQYLNVFQLISRNIETLIRARILDVYEQPTRRVIEGMVERGLLAVPEGCSIDEAVIRHSETVLRDLIAESFGLQRLDALVGRVLRSLVDELEASQPSAGARRAPVSLKHGIVRIDSGEAPGAGIVSLGNKGFMLKRLRQLGFRVPDGFILTTNLFRARGSGPLGRSLVSRVHQEVERLEHLSGARFGDPSRPLLLSVRGGCAAQHARDARDLPECGDEPGGRRGHERAEGALVGRLGRLPAPPSVLGDELRAGAGRLRRAHAGGQAAGRGPEEGAPARVPDARAGALVPGHAPRRRRAGRQRPLRATASRASIASSAPGSRRMPAPTGASSASPTAGGRR